LDIRARRELIHPARPAIPPGGHQPINHKEKIMGHEIDNPNGRFSFADSRTDAWHQLGQQVGHEMTPDEALGAAHMKGWNVRKIPLRVDISEIDNSEGTGATLRSADQLAEVPGQFAVVRTNPITGATEPLAVVGRFFEPTQNEATTQLLYDITDQSGAHIQTLGALRGGRETFVTMLMPTHIEFTGAGGFKDTTEVYLAVLNNHDGQGKLRAMVTPIRIVCANTQRLAEQQAVSTVGLRHTGAMATKMAEVRNLLGITFKYIDTFATEMEALVAAERDEVWVRAVLNDVFAVSKADSERAKNSRTERVTQVMEVMRRSPSIIPFAGTAYAAYNAVTEYADHFMPVTGKDKAAARAQRSLISPEVAALKGRTAVALKEALPLSATQLLASAN
jgi:phage/plasmid-like protein (TIGR03299 family)